MFHPVLSILLVSAMGVGSFIAVCFLWWLWHTDPRRSWLIGALARASTALMVGGWYLGWIAYLRITGGLAAVPEWTAPLTTLTTIMMGGVPIYFLFTFLRNSGYRGRR